MDSMSHELFPLMMIIVVVVSMIASTLVALHHLSSIKFKTWTLDVVDASNRLNLNSLNRINNYLLSSLLLDYLGFFSFIYILMLFRKLQYE